MQTHTSGARAPSALAAHVGQAATASVHAPLRIGLPDRALYQASRSDLACVKLLCAVRFKDRRASLVDAILVCVHIALRGISTASPLHLRCISPKAS